MYLASRSPRRKKLLEQIGLTFSSFSVDHDEVVEENETPENAVIRLSEEKMEMAFANVEEGILVTADTIVVLNNEIIGKPADKKEAFKILRNLSGNTHFVFTGFCIADKVSGKKVSDYVKTAVTFRHLSDDEIDDYIEGGSPMDKAGAYGIQDDFGAVFVKSIEGCYYNVVGLPLAQFYLKLKEFTGNC